MCELQTIYHEFENKGTFSFNNKLSFTLDNGFSILNKYYKQIYQREYIDSLEITSAYDIVEYIKSYNTIPDEYNNELYNLVKSKFDDTGTFHVNKEQGIFICKK